MRIVPMGSSGPATLWRSAVAVLAVTLVLLAAPRYSAAGSDLPGELSRFLRSPAKDDRPPDGLLEPIRWHYLRSPPALDPAKAKYPRQDRLIPQALESIPRRAGASSPIMPLPHRRQLPAPAVAATFRERFARQAPMRVVPARDLRRYFDRSLTEASRHLAVRSDDAFSEATVIEALVWILENHRRLEAGPELLRTLHVKLNARNRFLWHQARRMKDFVTRGEVSEGAALAVLRRVASGRSRLTRPLGIWRSPRWDQFRQDGFQKTAAGGWYFTPSQFDAISANPYFTLEAPAVERGGRLIARFWYLDAAWIADSLRDAFDSFRVEMARPMDDLERIRTLFRLRMCLISIHPFADGNGRTVQALMDSLLLSKGLPPPLEMLEDDFERPFESSFLRFVESMDAWLRIGEDVNRLE